MTDRITFRDGYRYQLVEDYAVDLPILPGADISNRFIRLTRQGRLIIRQDYAWDGPSGPTAHTQDGMRGALVHDALYQLMREGLLDCERWRAVADRIFHNVLLEDGMPPGRAALWYRGVQIFGEPSARPENAKPILTAP